jgi:hypothetical protein
MAEEIESTATRSIRQDDTDEMDVDDIELADDDQSGKCEIPPLFHPLAEVLIRLEDVQRESSWIEGHLEDGSSLRFERFLSQLSCRRYGAFVAEDDNASRRIVVVPWDRFHRLEVRNLNQLP